MGLGTDVEKGEKEKNTGEGRERVERGKEGRYL